MKGLPFPGSAPTPAHAETSTVSVTGENGLWDDEDRQDQSSRARRELSVIEESSSIAPRDEDDIKDPAEPSEEVEEEEVDAGDNGDIDDAESLSKVNDDEDRRSEASVSPVAREGTNPVTTIST
jgi:hypothetical protein